MSDIPKTVGPWLRSIRRPSVNDKAVAKLLAQLDKIGSNVNQLAHYANAGRPIGRMSNSIELALRDLAELRLACLQALGRELDREPPSGREERSGGDTAAPPPAP